MNGGKILIDSHVLVWLLYEPERIGTAAGQALQTAEAVYVSIVSLWELALKHNKGKLAYGPAELAQGVRELRAELLPLREAHIIALADVKLKHKDPFDGLLAAQSSQEQCVLLTADKLLLDSDCQTLALV